VIDSEGSGESSAAGQGEHPPAAGTIPPDAQQLPAPNPVASKILRCIAKLH
jgi:hypothetical protein